MKLAQPDPTQWKVQYDVQFAWKVAIRAEVVPCVISVLKGSILLLLVPYPRKYAQDVILASLAQRDQSCALTVDLDSILTVRWFALPVLLEPLMPVIAARVSRIATNAGLELMPQGGHRAVLHVMLDGMLKHLDQVSVFPVKLVGF